MGMEGAMTQPHARKHDRCRFCSQRRNAWLPVPQAPDGAMRLGHLSQHHPDQVGRSLVPLHTTEDLAPMALRAFEGIREYDRRLVTSPSPHA
jgi:hypothetical protein